MHVFSITQVAMIALEVARQSPAATDDQIATAIEFVDMMAADGLEELEDCDRELWNDLTHSVNSVNTHLEILFINAEELDATYMDLVA